MKFINGTESNIINIDQMIKLKDLITYDGYPLLTIYKYNNTDSYLFCWVDCDETYNRWLYLKITEELINKYLNKEITLYDIIVKSIDGFVYFVDIDSNIEYHNITRVLCKDIVNDYLPTKDSYYGF